MVCQLLLLIVLIIIVELASGNPGLSGILFSGNFVGQCQRPFKVEAPVGELLGDYPAHRRYQCSAELRIERHADVELPFPVGHTDADKSFFMMIFDVFREILFSCSTYGNRTRVTRMKILRTNPYTNGPLFCFSGCKYTTFLFYSKKMLIFFKMQMLTTAKL